MAKPIQIVVLLVGALSSLSFLNVSQGNDPNFYVEGEVYCDTCRAQFVTRLSESMPGAKVRLECRDPEGSNVTYSIEGETNESGLYRLPVNGDHENEICEIALVNSPKPDCAEIGDEGWAKATSRITLTSHNGMASSIRRANALGFMKNEALAECVDVYKEMGMLPPYVHV